MAALQGKQAEASGSGSGLSLLAGTAFSMSDPSLLAEEQVHEESKEYRFRAAATSLKACYPGIRLEEALPLQLPNWKSMQVGSIGIASRRQPLKLSAMNSARITGIAGVDDAACLAKLRWVQSPEWLNLCLRLDVLPHVSAAVLQCHYRPDASRAVSLSGHEIFGYSAVPQCV